MASLQTQIFVKKYLPIKITRNFATNYSMGSTGFDSKPKHKVSTPSYEANAR